MTRDNDHHSPSPDLGSWRRLAPVIAALKAVAGGSAGTADPDTVADLAAQEPGEQRTQRLLADPVLRRQYASLIRTGQEPRRAVPRSRPLVRWAGLALAAGLGGILLTGSPDRHRGASGSTVIVSEPVASQLVWQRVSGADLYEVEVVRRDGRVAFSWITSDTLLALPDSSAAAGAFYRVRARVDTDRWVTSPFQEFRARP